MSRREPTIYDLARLTKTSPSSVSAILNGTWKSRRVGEETANRVLELAKELKYTPNRQASGLRRKRSGLIGMIIPMHDNRFFSAMSQTFERLARDRHLYPIVVSTLRDPKLEAETARTLISYQVEFLLVTGATAPDAVSRICTHHGIAHLNVDLPGKLAPSVISDNRWGARELTTRLIARSSAPRSSQRNRFCFVGGIPGDYNTVGRIEGFSEAVVEAFGGMDHVDVDACGYDADQAEAAIRAIYKRLGGLPRGLFVNSTIALEGVVRFLKTLSLDEVRQCAIGSYDWDPFATCLSFPLLMVRQDILGLLGKAFEIIDSGKFDSSEIIQVRPELVEA
ncbi:MAG: LacI family DNA-binding transcriptional regulator [Acidovorax sp.]|jgi:LacI family fructose operon transcriptional repressor|nr:LacI family DNA-binding transcriptional regulator [Acidovorax sp.]